MSEQPPEQPRSFSQFLQQLEEGTFHAEVSDKLQTIAAKLNEHVQTYGGTAKGKLTIAINFVLEKGVFEITADATSKLPAPKRMRSIFWTTNGNNFTPSNPKQMQLFSVRDVTAPDAQEVRTV